MKQRLLIALLTVFVFGAGFGARMWTEADTPVPPAPTLGSEFINHDNGNKKPAPPTPTDRAKLVAEIEQLRPQIEAYRNRLDAIDAEFDHNFVEVLNPEQRKAYEANQAEYQKKRAERDAKAAKAPAPGPMTDEEIARARQRPFQIAFWRVSFGERLDSLTREYKLSPDQHETVRALLKARRDKFLSLVDSTQPPTFKLTTLLHSLPRLTDAGQGSTSAAPTAAPKK
jgi:hypothetical protein